MQFRTFSSGPYVFCTFFIAGSAGCTTQSKKRDTFYPVQNQPQEDPAVLREHQPAGLLPEMRHKSIYLSGVSQTRLMHRI